MNAPPNRASVQSKPTPGITAAVQQQSALGAVLRGSGDGAPIAELSQEQTPSQSETERVAARLDAKGFWVSCDLRTTEAACAHTLGISTRQLRNWRAEGRGPVFVVIGRALSYRLADVLAWISSRAVDPAKPPTFRGISRQFAAT